MGSQSRQANSTASIIEEGFQLFRNLIAEHPELAKEFAESRKDFGTRDPAASKTEQALQGQRHFEWFLLERDSSILGTRPVEAFLPVWLESASEELATARECYLESVTGILQVDEIDAEGIANAQDLSSLTRMRLTPASNGVSLVPGDVYVGRLYPTEGGLHAMSAAGGLFRNPSLAGALHADLERLRAKRAHAVMRLSQLELERMFWGEGYAGARPEPEVSDPVGELRAFFLESGVASHLIESWIHGLSRTQADPSSLATGANDFVGSLLEQLAIDTDLDLNRARELLLKAWPVLSAKGASSSRDKSEEQTPSDRDEVVEMLAEYDRDRQAGIDFEASFGELTKRLGLDEDDSEEDTQAPDFPEVVSAIVEEFLWEVSASSGPEESRSHEGLRIFGGYVKNIGVFENLGSREVLSFATFWLPESRLLKSGAEAERMVKALLAFGGWSAEQHGHELLKDGLDERLKQLESSLPRVVVANALLAKEQENTGELFTFVAACSDDQATIRDADEESRDVGFDARLLTLLEPGDLFRGYTGEDGVFNVCCCYPPEAAGLRQGLR
ncbi:MAG: hypothetical protein ACI8X5_001024 [Planctomycetota bacterium]|jgi:hypothetical protein